MFKKLFSKIRTRLLFLFIAVTSIPLLMSIWFVFNLVTETVTTSLKRNLDKASNKYYNLLTNYSYGLKKAELLASDDELKIKLFLGMDNQLRGRARLLSGEDTGLGQLLIVDSDRKVKIRTNQLEKYGDILERQDIKQAVKNIKSVGLKKIKGNIYIYATVPIKDSYSKLILGALSILIKVDDSILNNILTIQGTEIGIISSDSKMFHSTGVMKKIEKKYVKDILKAKQTYLDINLGKNNYMLSIRKIKELENSKVSCLFLTAIESGEFIYMSRMVLRRIVAVSIVLLSFAVLIAMLMSHKITVPILKLSKTVKEIIREEKFRIKEIDVYSKDEIGQLADSFRKMLLHIEDSQEKLVRTSKLATIGQLAAGISHEINNPLVTILGYSQLALENIDEKDKIKKYIEIIEDDAKRCKKVISNLLSFARKTKRELKSVNINELIYSVTILIAHQTRKKNIEVKNELQKDIPEVIADADQLKQVLVNLIINAIHAIEKKNEKNGELVFRTYFIESENYTAIDIKDNGIGIPKDEVNKIFEPYYTSESGQEGTGLGLSISFNIIEEHYGTIKVKSEQGEGTTFTILLPAKKET